MNDKLLNRRKRSVLQNVEMTVIGSCLLAAGALANEVSSINEQIKGKADKDVVQVQYESIQKQITISDESLEQQIERIYKILNHQFRDSVSAVDGAHGE